MAPVFPPTVAEFRQRSLDLHRRLAGKLSVVAKEPVTDFHDLALLYTPGVAEPCLEIAARPETVYDYTGKGNLVAVVTDGSAVLGLGDIGPEAALPVMEGKALLFKEFAGIDAVPILLGVRGVDQIVAAVTAVAPTFGGINLEDIAAPRCFAVEAALQNALDIPVFHDDQHGTAVVVLAALTTAAKKTGKVFSRLRVVVNGAGAAGTAVSRLLLSAGLSDLVVCDRMGILTAGDPGLNPSMAELARATNPRGISGTLAEALAGADAFVGVSAPGVLTTELVRSMAPGAIVFALANPEPEIFPAEALAAGASVVATGRSDFPNQINNVLAFPGIFRGALTVRARRITEGMKLAAALAIADLAGTGPEGPDAIVPSVFHRELVFHVALAVALTAVRDGVARFEQDRSALVRGIQKGLVEAGASVFHRVRHFAVSSGAPYRVQERIGEALVRLGVLAQDQCDRILGVQGAGDDRLFGEIALESGFLEFDTLIDYLRRSGGNGVSNLVEAEIWTVAKTNEGNAVLVRPVGGDKAVPIFIGPLEAQNILLGLGEVEIPRPLTHDLLLSLLLTLDTKLLRVDIHTLSERTYYSNLILEHAGRRLEVDARPSDSLALAVRADCPIYIDLDLVEESGVSLEQLREAAVEADAEEGDDEPEAEPSAREAELVQFRKLLNLAVAREDYEEAARLRDQIQKLEDA